MQAPAEPPPDVEDAASSDPSAGSDTPLSIFLRFLKIGMIAWGGPAAQTQILYRECVEQEKWVTPNTFRKTLAVYQVLPGPEMTELSIYFGRIRAGRLAGLLAGLGFLLPGFLLMLAVSICYVEFDLAERFGSFFGGMQAAVGGMIAMAVIRLGKRFLDDVPLAVIALVAFALSLGIGLSFVAVLLLGGLAYEAVRWTRGGDRGLFAISPVALVLIAAATGGTVLMAEVFFEGLKAGLLTFGGAYTVIPFLQHGAVETNGWLTSQQFIDGVALAGILPAPLVIITTFTGYLADGLAGALLMTLGIFLPAFVLPTFLHSPLTRLSEHPRLDAFLHGVTAGVIGLIAAVGIRIVGESVTGIGTAAIAAVAFVVLFRVESKLTNPAVVVGSGLLGALLQVGNG